MELSRDLKALTVPLASNPGWAERWVESEAQGSCRSKVLRWKEEPGIKLGSLSHWRMFC